LEEFIHSYVFEFLKHITPKTKILFLSMCFILIPGAVISYLSMKSIQEKADNLKVKYHGTVNLVGDKLESEVFQLESNFRNSLLDSLLKQEGEADLQKLLESAGLKYPAFKNLMLIGNNGELITSIATLGLNRTSSTKNQINRELSRAISDAEKSEFIEKNYSGAIKAYRKAFIPAVSPGEKAMLHSRIGRNYYKLHQYENGILEYKKILESGGGDLTIGNVPASIVALHQIAEGYKALGEIQEQKSILLELFRQLLDHPWDLSGGEYIYYLKSTITEIGEIEASDTRTKAETGIPDEMRSREEKLMEQAKNIHLIEGKILEELMPQLKHLTSSETKYKLFQSVQGSAIELNYFILPPAIHHTRLKALVFQFDEDYFLTELFPRVLSAVELGKDVTVGILNEKDSLLFIQNDLQISRYLVAGNFTQFFINWKVALFDTTGRSIEQLAGRERHLYLALFIGILAVMLIGIVVLARAVIHETEISSMKSEFVSNVTHELKTPLSLIRMFGETLESGIVNEEGKRKEFYSIIRKESERLTHLINNVLDFSRIDSGIKEYDIAETDLASIIRHSLEAYKFHIRDRGFEIESKIPGEPVMVFVDKDAISQAFLNLLSNAVKYSEDCKYIGVEISREKDLVKISVADHGIGMAKGELKRIFDKFYRVPNYTVKQARGSGLGLTLTRHIIEAHGGTIDVESEPGKGSRFTIRLPVR
jgi:signal transduction histidine kinase